MIETKEERQIETLGDALPKEIARCKELLKVYESIGAPGRIGAAMLEHAINMAERANTNQDAIAMIRAYNELTTFTE